MSSVTLPLTFPLLILMYGCCYCSRSDGSFSINVGVLEVVDDLLVLVIVSGIAGIFVVIEAISVALLTLQTIVFL